MKEEVHTKIVNIMTPRTCGAYLKRFKSSTSFVQLKTFQTDQITVYGCLMSRAYEIRTQ